MAKYIIELPENTHWVQWILESTKDHHPYMGFKQVEDLTPYTEPDLAQVREEAYDDGYNAGYGRKIDASYQEGLSDAWEAARKICLEDDDGGIPASAINDIFSVRNYRNALRDFSVSEAIEKIRQYEQEKTMDGLRQNIRTIVDQCGYTLDEIAEVLAKMKETDNG